ncbi:MAG: serine/threonine protein kinase [Phototrophicaceae bacterium]
MSSQPTKDPLKIINTAIAGRYRVDRLIGGGGMGIVYLAQDMELKRLVAIKFLLGALVKDPQIINLFKNEARLVAGLNHAYILSVFDSNLTPNAVPHPYIVMRYMRRGSLQDALKVRKEPMRLSNVLWVIPPIADALDYAHRHQVIHRDVKPANLLMDEEAKPYLADFGIAKKFTTLDAQTQDGLIGTFPFMAPEMWSSSPITGAVDQYALAIVVWVMLTLHTPFSAHNPYDLMNHHLHTPPPNVQDRNLTVPSAVNQVLQRALAKSPSARFPSTLEFSKALQAAIQNPAYNVRAVQEAQVVSLPNRPEVNGIKDIKSANPRSTETRPTTSSIASNILLIGLVLVLVMFFIGLFLGIISLFYRQILLVVGVILAAIWVWRRS